MGEGGDDLWRDLSELADGYANLGRELRGALGRLHRPGVLPSEDLIGEVERLRGGFTSLRTRVAGFAAGVGAGVDAAALGSLRGLALLLEAAVEAERKRNELADRAARAVALLDRVAGLRHAAEPAFVPLAQCLEQAASLRRVVAATAGGPVDPDTAETIAGLAESDHPFGYLLMLVDGIEAMSDDLWEGLFEMVSRAFGRPLAAAVARGKIVSSDAPALALPPASDAPAPAPAADTLAEPVAEPVSASAEGPADDPRVDAVSAPASPVDEAVELLDAEREADPDNPLSPAASSSGLPGYMARRRGARPGRRKSPRVERLETVRLLSCSIIGGHVFLDANDDGVFQPGEAPLADNPIELRNATGVVVGSTQTDGQGYYAFSTDSTVDTDPRTVEQQVTIPERNTNFAVPFTLAQFDPALGELIGVEIVVTGTLSSDIKAENMSPSSPDTLRATVSGSIRLTGPGLDVSGTLSSPAGVFDAAPYDGQLDYAGTSGKDFGTQSAPIQTTVSRSSPADDLSAFVGPGTMAGTFEARATSGASGGGNLQVESLSTATATVRVVYRYIPENCLEPGNYTIVQLEQPPGTLNGQRSSEGVVLPPVSSGPDTIPVTLTGGDLLRNDFGELLPSSLSGTVYYDQNDNGVLDTAEPGIAGVAVTLRGTDDQGAVERTVRTDATGSYAFPGLRPGRYEIVEAQPAGYLQGTNSLGTRGGSLSGDQFTGIDLAQDRAGTRYDFGELLPSSLSGTVYYDQNDNGVLDTAEPGIAGVAVTLRGTDDQGAVERTVRTDATGSYAFPGLRPGRYEIVEAQPAGYLQGTNSLGTRGGSLSGDQFTGIDLAQDRAGTRYDFGELLPGSLNGYVYVDENRDGLRESNEPGLPGVAITLTGTDDHGQPVVASTLTDARGYYTFDGLRPGTYAVAEPTQPVGYDDGQDTRGNVVPLPNSASTDVIPGIGVVPGGVAAENDFGEYRPGVPGGGGGGGGGGVDCDLATLVGVDRLGLHHQPTRFVLHFSAPLDPITATDVNNYHLVVAYRDGSFGVSEVPIRSAVYDPAASTVTLTPARGLNIHRHYQLTVSGLRNDCGAPLDGNGDGVAGDPAVVIVTRRNHVGPLHAAGNRAATAAGWANRFPRLAAAQRQTGRPRPRGA